MLEAKQESSGKAAKIRTGITDYSALNSMCCCSAWQQVQMPPDRKKEKKKEKKTQIRSFLQFPKTIFFIITHAELEFSQIYPLKSVTLFTEYI